MIRIGVFGAGGRMGVTVCRAVLEEPDLDLVAAVDPPFSGRPLGHLPELFETDLVIAGEPAVMTEANVDVAVDFTVAASAIQNTRWCLQSGIHAVVGTTGISPEDLAEISDLADQSPANAVIAPNFALGAALMMEFAARAARYFPDAEVIELHHPGKLDSPSGTAIRTAQIISSLSEAAPTRVADQKGGDSPDSRGERRGNVRIHSVRLPGLVAHQEIIFGGPGQTLTIRHDSSDRSSFMPGVLMAVRRVARLPGLTVGLERLLTD